MVHILGVEVGEDNSVILDHSQHGVIFPIVGKGIYIQM